jgi:hypothetical protein
MDDDSKKKRMMGLTLGDDDDNWYLWGADANGMQRRKEKEKSNHRS